jgi:hypothetical protein
MSPERAAFSRNCTTSPFGKLDDFVDGFRVESSVKEKFAQCAAELDKNPTEFLRDVMRVVAFGPDTVKRMHSQQVDRVVEMLGRKSGE